MRFCRARARGLHIACGDFTTYPARTRPLHCATARQVYLLCVYYGRETRGGSDLGGGAARRFAMVWFGMLTNHLIDCAWGEERAGSRSRVACFFFFRLRDAVVVATH